MLVESFILTVSLIRNCSIATLLTSCRQDMNSDHINRAYSMTYFSNIEVIRPGEVIFN